MSFWDKVKEFVGVEEDYIDDDFYEDYDDLEDSRYYSEDKLENASEYEKAQEAVDKDVTTSFKAESKPSYKPEAPVRNERETSSRREDRVSKRVNYTSTQRDSNSKMFVSIKEPLTYEDAKLVLDDIMEGKSVILNLEMLEQDKKTQIFYFVSGGLYSLKGTIQNVTKDIFVLAPQGVEIDGAIKSEISKTNLYQI